MCGTTSGTQKLAGTSGTEHDVFVVHREDGSVWLRFGQGNMEGNWTFVSLKKRNSLFSPFKIFFPAFLLNLAALA